MSSPESAFESLGINRALFGALEAAGVKHCHFKSNDHLAEALAGKTDLDVLVPKGEAALVERILGALGFRRVISQIWARHPGIEDWMGFDQLTGALTHLHLHYTLLTGTRFVKEQRLPWEALILETAVLDEEHGVRVTEPALELVLLLARIALKTRWRDLKEDGYLPRNIQSELDWLRGRADMDRFAELSRTLFPSGPAQAQILKLGLDGGAEKAREGRRLKRAVLAALAEERRFGQQGALLRGLQQKARFFEARVRRKLELHGQWGKRLHTGGRLIAVIGCDGAGKSTLTQALARWLSWKIDTRLLYLGVGDGNVRLRTRLLKKLARRGGNAPADTDAGASKGSESGAQRPSAQRSVIDLAKQVAKDLGVGVTNLSLADERVRKLRKARRMRRDGAVLLTDRFPQVQFRGIYDGPRTIRRAAATPVRGYFADKEERLFDEMVRAVPDLVIRLVLPAEIAVSRKPEHVYEAIKVKVDITPQLQFPGATVVDLDATLPPEEVLLRAKRLVWQHL